MPSKAQFEQQFRRAIALHQQGRLDVAAGLYDELLQLQPEHTDLLHLRGLVALQGGRLVQGTELISRAVKARPLFPEALNNLGNGLRALSRPAEALAAYDRALALKPTMVEAHSNRGLALMDMRRPAEAKKSFDAALSYNPNYAPAYCNRGGALLELGRFADAITDFERAIVAQAGLMEAYAGLVNALIASGDASKALAVAERARRAQPQSAAAQIAVGSAWLSQRQADMALIAFDAALKLESGAIGALIGKARALTLQGRSDEALAHLDEVIIRAPAQIEARVHRAYALLDLRRFEDALAGIDGALKLDRENAGARRCRGDILHQLERKAEALFEYQAVLDSGQSLGFSRGYFLTDKLDACDWRDLESQANAWADTIEGGGVSSDPFPALVLFDRPALHTRCAQHAAHQAGRLGAIATPLRGGDGARIKVGYFSSDFRNHPVTHLLRGALAAHDRREVEVSAFSFGPNKDAWTDGVVGAVDKFFDVADTSSEQLVELARGAGLDVAIDLNGYTKFARTAIFAARVAPVQMAYLGYVGPMAADFYDYLIADPVMIPPELRQHYREHVAYLPWYQSNDEDANAAGEPLARSNYGLPDDAFVFCSFNNSYKITPRVFDAWMSILRRTPGSVLWLYASSPAAARNLQRSASDRGVEEQRIIIAPRAPRAEHLARQRCADLLLDTFPYNGGTTSSNALRAGLPVLTLCGSAFASRMGASLLTAIGAEELIARDFETFETKAVQLAADPVAYAAAKAKLKGIETQKLFDAAATARHLEAVFRDAVDRQRRGEAPADIVICA